MQESNTLNTELITNLLNAGYVLKHYPEQGIDSYATTIPITVFMSKYGPFENYVGETNSGIIELLGDSVTIEYIPSTNCAQWCTHNLSKETKTPDYSDYEVFNFANEPEQAIALLRLFAIPNSKVNL